MNPPVVNGSNFGKRTLQLMPDDILVGLWNAWDGGKTTFWLAGYWHEDVYWELMRRGIDPVELDFADT